MESRATGGRTTQGHPTVRCHRKAAGRAQDPGWGPRGQGRLRPVQMEIAGVCRAQLLRGRPCWTGGRNADLEGAGHRRAGPRQPESGRFRGLEGRLDGPAPQMPPSAERGRFDRQGAARRGREGGRDDCRDVRHLFFQRGRCAPEQSRGGAFRVLARRSGSRRWRVLRQGRQVAQVCDRGCRLADLFRDGHGGIGRRVTGSGRDAYIGGCCAFSVRAGRWQQEGREEAGAVHAEVGQGMRMRCGGGCAGATGQGCQRVEHGPSVSRGRAGSGPKALTFSLRPCASLPEFRSN